MDDNGYTECDTTGGIETENASESHAVQHGKFKCYSSLCLSFSLCYCVASPLSRSLRYDTIHYKYHKTESFNILQTKNVRITRARWIKREWTNFADRKLWASETKRMENQMKVGQICVAFCLKLCSHIAAVNLYCFERKHFFRITSFILMKI